MQYKSIFQKLFIINIVFLVAYPFISQFLQDKIPQILYAVYLGFWFGWLFSMFLFLWLLQREEIKSAHAKNLSNLKKSLK